MDVKVQFISAGRRAPENKTISVTLNNVKSKAQVNEWVVKTIGENMPDIVEQTSLIDEKSRKESRKERRAREAS